MTERKNNPKGALTFLQELGPIVPRDEKEKIRQQGIARFKRDSASLLRDLTEAGFMFDSLADMARSRTRYEVAVPILLKGLVRTANYEVKEAIVRSLSVPWAKPDAGRILVNEFRESDSAIPPSYKWAVANALSIVADEGLADDLIELAINPKHGKSREMLAVALGEMKDIRAIDILLELLKDDQMVGHAIIGLGKLKVSKTRPFIEPFLHHKKAWIRSEAKKALVRIDRDDSKKAAKLVSKQIH